MSRSALWGRATGVLGAVVVASVAAYGMFLRMEDPLSTPVISAEDPYTHIALTREHLADGNIDPLHKGSIVYPPGFHILLGTAHVFTGLSMHTLALWTPATLGTLGIIGIALLARRFWGWGAAALSAVTYAVVPEAIYRSSMLAPTALDLALLPYLVLAVTMVLEGRLRWLVALVLMSLLVLFAHPWLFGALATGGVAAVIFLLLRGRHESEEHPHWGGIAAVVAVIGIALGLAMGGCNNTCGPGFDRIIDTGPLPSFDILSTYVTAIALLPLVAWTIWRATGRPDPETHKTSPWLSGALGITMAIGAAMILRVALQEGLPTHVSERNFGRPVLLLGLAGIAVAPFARSPLSVLAAGLFWGTFPFVVFNPFDSAYWPHRTMVYLAFAIALLIGGLAHVIIRSAAALAHTLRSRLQHPAWRAPWQVAVAGALVVGAGTTVVAETPEPYDWYRLYDECEHEALRHIAIESQEDPEALFVAGSWQTKLVLAAYGSHATRLWYSSGFFADAGNRDNVVKGYLSGAHYVHVVTDKHLPEESPDADLSFLDSEAWREAGRWCDGSIVHYVTSEEPRFLAKAGNDWWVEVDVLTPLPVNQVEWRTDGPWQPLERQDWGSWADSVHVGNATPSFRALVDGKWIESG